MLRPVISVHSLVVIHHRLEGRAMPHKRCRVEVTRLVVTALRKWGACGWHQWSSGLRTISPRLVPSRAPRTSLLGDFLLKAAMSMTPTELAPNAPHQARLKAGARDERAL